MGPLFVFLSPLQAGPSFVFDICLGHTEVMADDDIERLLREVNAMNNPSSPAAGGRSPEASKSKDVAKKDDSCGGGAGGRLAFAVASAVVVGGLGAAFGAILFVLPFVGPITTGVGAALGGFITALVAGPPRWFSS